MEAMLPLASRAGCPRAHSGATGSTVREAALPRPVTTVTTGLAAGVVAASLAAGRGVAASRGSCRNRRSARFSKVASDAADGADAALAFESDDAGRRRLQYKPEGWSSWTWKPSEEMGRSSFKINYIAAGPEDGQCVLLVHGFGASSYHWRYQVATLAEQGYRVYSMCLLGYGWSDRAVLQYSGEVWAAQINDFLKQVAGDRPTVLVGNSIGAFATLLAAATASTASAAAGLVLLNAAGRFEERQPGEAPARKQAGDLVAEAEEQAEPGPIQWALQQVRRALASWAFYTTKLRIEPILQWVYVNEQQVDEDLVTSIRMPAEHPQALDAFAEVIQAGRRTQVSVFEALDALPSSLPVLLIWGMQDPWMRPARASAILAECATRGIGCQLVEVEDAGHCPQDDAPGAVNEALVSWLEERVAKVPA